MSKKLMDSLINDLNKKEGSAGPATEEKSPDPAVQDNMPEDIEPADRSPAEDLKREITACIDGLQQAFGPRIERISGSGNGLLTVLDQVNGEDDRIADKLSQQIPVVLIDQRTLTGLERLGAGSPVAGADTYYDATQQQQNNDQQTSRLAALAMEKLKSATVLIEQDCTSGALELLLSALLDAAADRTGRDTQVPPQEAGVWLYGEAIPRNLLTEEEAALIMRAVSLAQAPSVPAPLLAELRDDVEDFVSAGS